MADKPKTKAKKERPIPDESGHICRGWKKRFRAALETFAEANAKKGTVRTFETLIMCPYCVKDMCTKYNAKLVNMELTGYSFALFFTFPGIALCSLIDHVSMNGQRQTFMAAFHYDCVQREKEKAATETAPPTNAQAPSPKPVDEGKAPPGHELRAASDILSFIKRNTASKAQIKDYGGDELNLSEELILQVLEELEKQHLIYMTTMYDGSIGYYAPSDHMYPSSWTPTPTTTS